MYTKAPVMAPMYNWTGFYIGLNAGGSWGRQENDLVTVPGGLTVFSGSDKLDGFIGGGQIGYNWHTGPVVFGLEADFQGSAGSGDLNGGPAGGVSITGGTLKTPWFGTIRGRIGYAWDRWMLYATGGGVYGHLDYSGTTVGGTIPGAFSSSTDFWTWTVGGGVEASLWDRWSAKVEYLYIGTPDSFPVPPGTTGASGSINTNIVRVGLNYHF